MPSSAPLQNCNGSLEGVGEALASYFFASLTVSGRWSLKHMVQVLRSVTLDTAFNTNSADCAEVQQMVETLKSWGNMAA